MYMASAMGSLGGGFGGAGGTTVVAFGGPLGGGGGTNVDAADAVPAFAIGGGVNARPELLAFPCFGGGGGIVVVTIFGKAFSFGLAFVSKALALAAANIAAAVCSAR